VAGSITALSAAVIGPAKVPLISFVWVQVTGPTSLVVVFGERRVGERATVILIVHPVMFVAVVKAKGIVTDSPRQIVMVPVSAMVWYPL